jgi:hypothetical protein
MAIDYTHRNIMVVLRYSTTEQPGIKIQFAFFVAGDGIKRDNGINTYVYDILHTIHL